MYKGSSLTGGLDVVPGPARTVRTVALQLLSWSMTGPLILPVTALLAHYFGPVQYGEYSFTLPFLATCALLSGTGMDPLIVRRLSRQRRSEWRDTLSYAAGSRLLSTLLSIGVIWLLAAVLPLAVEVRCLLVLGSASLLFSFTYNGWRAIYLHGFHAEQRVSLLVWLETVNRWLMAAMAVLVVMFHLPLLLAYALILYIDLPCFIVLMYIARRRFGVRIRFSLARMREHLLDSLPLTGYDALALITNQADVLLLMLFSGPLQVGLYSLGLRITDPLLTMALACMSGIYPLLCLTFEKGRASFNQVYREALRMLSLIILPVSFFISIEAAQIVVLLGGQLFGQAVVVVQLLTWATATIFYSQLAAQSCTAANMERFVPVVALASAVINLLGNLLLIPLWHATGAGVAALVSEFTTLVLFSLLLRRHVPLLPAYGAVLRVFLGSLPACAFLWWQSEGSLLLNAICTLVLTLVGCFATRALTWRDLQLAKRYLFPGRAAPAEPVAHTQKEIGGEKLAYLPDRACCSTLILPRIRFTGVR
ncbi:MAG: flippase [Ktedonobacteraceae bacterium]|nr:flippase [Ktedonobacteraceae bacterium]